MWESILPPFKELTWTPASLNVKIVGSGIMLLYLAEFKDWNVSSAIVLTNLKIIVNLGSAAKPTKKPILYVLKQKKVNYVHILSSAPITMAITRWTPTFVYSGNIGSIVNGIAKNISRSIKTGQNWSIWLWMILYYDLWCFKVFFSKHSKKQINCWYHSRDSIIIWYCFHSRTSIVNHLFYSKFH